MAALDVLDGVVRKSDRTDESGVGEFRHGAPRLLEGDAGAIGPVEEVEVEVLAPESAQARAAGCVDLIATEPRSAARDSLPRRRFRCDQEVVIDPSQGFSHQRLVAGVEVVLRGVEPIDASLEGCPDHPLRPIDVGVLSWLRPELVPSETHGETDTPLRPIGRVWISPSRVEARNRGTCWAIPRSQRKSNAPTRPRAPDPHQPLLEDGAVRPSPPAHGPVAFTVRCTLGLRKGRCVPWITERRCDVSTA